MPQIIADIGGACRIEFDTGSFDSWCVYLTKTGNRRYAPRDLEYFMFLKQLAEEFGEQKIYSDFKKIYHKTTSWVTLSTLQLIQSIAANYGAFSLDYEIWLTVIYAGMVAEENKGKAVLKKRVKRLGIHQLLVEGFSPSEAANFSKGKSWQELDKIMWERGF